jgi:DNA recombination-dependent growth factor C
MPITAGSITCRLYEVAKPPKGSFLAEIGSDLKRHAFHPVQVERSPRSIGWVNPRDILDTDLKVEKVVFEDFLVLGLRVDKVGVNARLLKAYFHQERQKLLEQRSKKELNRDERMALLEKVKIQLMARQSPATSLYEMAWNLRSHHVLFSASSTTLNQEFMDLFSDTFHTGLTPLMPSIRAHDKAEKAGLLEEFQMTEPAHFSPLARVHEAGSGDDDE